MIGMPSAFALGIFSGKFILYFRDSGTPAGVPLSHFHRKRRGGKLPVNRCALSRENAKTGSPRAARLCSCQNNFTRSESIYFHRFSGY